LFPGHDRYASYSHKSAQQHGFDVILSSPIEFTNIVKSNRSTSMFEFKPHQIRPGSIKAWTTQSHLYSSGVDFQLLDQRVWLWFYKRCMSGVMKAMDDEKSKRGLELCGCHSYEPIRLKYYCDICAYVTIIIVDLVISVTNCQTLCPSTPSS
jgi:hypothetical protein